MQVTSAGVRIPLFTRFGLCFWIVWFPVIYKPFFAAYFRRPCFLPFSCSHACSLWLRNPWLLSKSVSPEFRNYLMRYSIKRSEKKEVFWAETRTTLRVSKETMYDVSVSAGFKLQKPAHRLMKGEPFGRWWDVLWTRRNGTNKIPAASPIQISRELHVQFFKPTVPTKKLIKQLFWQNLSFPVK